MNDNVKIKQKEKENKKEEPKKKITNFEKQKTSNSVSSDKKNNIISKTPKEKKPSEKITESTQKTISKSTEKTTKIHDQKAKKKLSKKQTKAVKTEDKKKNQSSQKIAEEKVNHSQKSMKENDEASAESSEKLLQNEIEMYEKTMETVRKGNIVKGTIIRVEPKEVLVDIGYKAEGVIPITEFASPEKAKKGKEIPVYIVKREDRQGRPLLSKKRADIQKTWKILEERYKKSEKVKVIIKKRVKGGMIIDVDNIDAFLPASQVSTKTLPNLDHLINKEFEFVVINFDREKSNIVLSRKAVLEAEQKKNKEELLNKLKENAEVDGVVKNIMDYGVFVDLGGIDGLLHISDMSWGHIDHPSEMLSIGDKIKVKVISFDKSKEKVSLGLKQLVPHPWKNIEIKYPEGSKVKGRVTNLTKYGAFVELEKGVEGLIHVTEMSWTKKISHPKQMLKVNDNVDAIVLTVDKDEHRISLGLKQIEPNPWLTIDIRHPVGSTITGKIKNITNFGAFVEVEDDIDGLIHISDLSWTKRIMHPSDVLKKGQKVKAKVLSVDKVMQRIALGIKQLKSDPWDNVEKDFAINSEHKVNILKIIPKGALVQAENEIEGFVPTSHLGIPGLLEPELAFDEGEKLFVKVIEVDKENRRLIFSVKTYYFGREEEEINQFVAAHLKKIKERRIEKKKKEAEDEKKDSK